MTAHTLVGAKFSGESEPSESELAARLQLDVGERWYVVMTQSGKEQFAAENLTHQGFRSFLPRQTTTYRHSRRTSTRLTPVFPQYLFVILDPAKQRWRAVNGTLGVRNLISSVDGPMPIRAGVVESMLVACDRKGVIQLQTTSLKPGDRVRLLAGPFAGMLGSLQSLNASGRVRLLLEIMSGKILASADVNSISLEP